MPTRASSSEYPYSVQARLVVVSACESGVAGRTLPDEVVSLSNARIEAGCGSVIGSLWLVDDQAAALVMLLFYEGIERGLAPAAALCQAQVRLRDSTNAQLLTLLKATGDGPSGEAYRRLRRQLIRAEPEVRSFSSPAR